MKKLFTLKNALASLSLCSIIVMNSDSFAFEKNHDQIHNLDLKVKAYYQKEKNDALKIESNIKKDYTNIGLNFDEWRKRTNAKIEENIPFFRHIYESCMNQAFCKDEINEDISNKVASIMINEYLQMLSEDYSFTVKKINGFINEVRTYVSTEYDVSKNSFSRPNLSKEESIIIGKQKESGFLPSKNIVMAGLKVYADGKNVHINTEVKTQVYDSQIKAEYDPLNKRIDFGVKKDLSERIGVSFGHTIRNNDGFSYVNMKYLF